MITEKNVTLTSVPPGLKERVELRIKEAAFAPSSAGNPQVTVKCEVVKPLTVKLDNKTYALDTLEPTYYFATVVKGDEEKTRAAQGAYFEFRKKLGLNPDFDETNAQVKDLEGVCFAAVIGSKQRLAQRQIIGTKKYENLKDAEGKDVPLGFELTCDKRDILYRVEVKANRPF